MASMHDPPERANDDVELLISGPRALVDMRFRQLMAFAIELTIEDVSDLDQGRRCIQLRWPGPNSLPRSI